ncbi:30S ribosomal protein S6 [Candidatus Aerophobetes bacterium]|uniref:Small ribosomal subunit protein bS6 n=1 Tax=Aerophobetes bacterium TaxID=2030807 RepID=A0A523UNZ1_UNCAE|nr:MAG: 30S ribosomal protein S6 [Candidatus Aerophobetes bacterium]
MDTYEVILAFQPELDEEIRKATLEKLESIISDGKGKIEDLNQLGMRKFAYEVKKAKEGFFVLASFQTEPSQISRIREFLNSDEVIVRAMLTKQRIPAKGEKDGQSEQSAVDRTSHQGT